MCVFFGKSGPKVFTDWINVVNLLKRRRCSGHEKARAEGLVKLFEKLKRSFVQLSPLFMLTLNVCVWLYVFNSWPVLSVFCFLLLAVVLVSASLGHSVGRFLFEELRCDDGESYSSRHHQIESDYLYQEVDSPF